MQAKAAAHGRKVRFGIRLHVIVRETNEEAQAADRLISHLDDETIAKAQAAFAKTDSVGQHRMASLHNGKRENLEISPNLWAGVGWYAVAQVLRWWVTARPSRRVSTNMPSWVSTALSLGLSAS